MAITKVQELTDIGTITTGDKLVGERVDGTTVRIDYAVDVTLDLAPVLGGNLGYGGFSIVDNSNNELLKFSPVASAVNELTLANAATAGYPTISATGNDSNINIGYVAKGTGQHLLQSTNTSPIVVSSGTALQHTTTFAMANTAASRTVTWPDASGTVCYDTGSSNIVTVGTVTTGTWQATIIGMTYGGTGANLTASNGGIVYTNASTMAVLAGTATANKILLSGASSAPTWSIPTFPNASATAGKRIVSDGTNWIASTTTMPDTGTTGKLVRGNGTNYVETTSTFADTYSASTILYSNGANTVTGLATANSGVLVTSGAGVPSIATDIPTAVTVGGAYNYRAGGTDIAVADGGTNLSSYNQGDLLYASATTTIATLAKDTNSTRYLSNQGTSNNPSWNQINLANGVTGTLPIANGGTGVTAIPSFSAKSNANQSITTATFTKVQLQTEAFDVGSYFDNVTNYRYTPLIAGTYLAYGTVCLNAPTDQSELDLAIYKNGVLFLQNTQYASGTVNNVVFVTTLVTLNGSTDYLELYVFQGTGVNKNILSTLSQFGAVWVGP